MTSLPTSYQEYIHLSRYARWDYDKGRRETWEETVERYFDFFEGSFNTDNDEELNTLDKLERAMLNLDIMPSMRCLMTAGKALERDNVAGYNCSYLPVDHPRAFDETMYILLCGTGVGFSVERQFIAKLPEVSESFEDTDTVINVRDSKIGWASALRELISLLYAGQVPSWNTSKLRPRGARLKTFGGRASGPEPLRQLFDYVVLTFLGAKGRKLNSVECYDIICKIADVVVSGGVRRSACISLSNLSDDRMRRAKTGEWYLIDPHRALTNNSVAYTEKPDFESFLKEWRTLYKAKSGERGIINREAFKKKCAAIGRDHEQEFGANPCGEIILRPNQFCNLSEVVVRPTDTLSSLKEKVRLATILGTLQATLTDFRYLRKVWKNNTEEEALLGVSLTGIMDNPVMNGFNSEDTLIGWLNELKQVAKETNKEWSEKLGIRPAAAITCIKPSGTVSQLVNSSSGIHPRYSRYFKRVVANDKTDPVVELMQEQEVPSFEDDKHVYFTFPMEAPEEAVCAEDISAMEQLSLWEIYAKHWCDHNPSQTVYYDENSFLDIGAWVWKNFDHIGGLSFFPYSDHIQKNSPYQPCSKEEYEELLKEMPVKIDWSKLHEYEKEDHTAGSQEYACSAPGGCEI